MFISPNWYSLLVRAVNGFLDTLIVPKVSGPADVQTVATLLSRDQRRGHVGQSGRAPRPKRRLRWTQLPRALLGSCFLSGNALICEQIPITFWNVPNWGPRKFACRPFIGCERRGTTRTSLSSETV